MFGSAYYDYQSKNKSEKLKNKWSGKYYVATLHGEEFFIIQHFFKYSLQCSVNDLLIFDILDSLSVFQFWENLCPFLYENDCYYGKFGHLRDVPSFQKYYNKGSVIFAEDFHLFILMIPFCITLHRKYMKVIIEILP